MKDFGDLNNWTKNDLARVIVQALFNADQPAKPDNIHVKRKQRNSKDLLVCQAAQAIDVINKRKYGATSDASGFDNGSQ